MLKLSHHVLDDSHRFQLFTERLRPIFHADKGGWQDFARKTLAHLDFAWGNKYKLCTVGFELDPSGELGPEIMFKLCIPWLFTLFLAIPFKAMRRLEEVSELSVTLYHADRWIGFKAFSTMNSWCSTDPLWKRGFSFHYADFFLGKAVYNRKVVRTFETPVTVPGTESYPDHDCIFWTLLCVDTWKRRFWKAVTLVRYDTTFIAPVPFESKWGRDAHYSECGCLAWASVERTLNDKNYQAMMAGHIKQHILKGMKKGRI